MRAVELRRLDRPWRFVVGRALEGNAFFDQLEADHRAWLSAFDRQYLVDWERLLRNDEEAAFTEARARALLEAWGTTVQPNESLTGEGQRPDFQCFVRESKFYVEATCIRVETATAKTGISTGRSHEARPFRPLNKAVFDKCVGKVTQCGGLDAPTLLAIGTLHTEAAMWSFSEPFVNWLLTGEPRLTYTVDPRKTAQVGHPREHSEANCAPFLEFDQKTRDVDYARLPISGLLLFRFGITKVEGVLHPRPVRPFDPALLPHVDFRRVTVDTVSGRLRVSSTRQDMARPMQEA